VGSSPLRWTDASTERTEAVAQRSVPYWCVNGHRTEPVFAAEVPAPDTWECPRCGLPAGTDRANPPARPQAEPYKTHLAYVKERRSEADGAAILAEALQRLRQRRGE
jgi:hypothetical protein